MLNVIPARTQGLPVYRANLNLPVLNAEHGKAAGLDHAGRGHPNRKAGRQEQPWDDRRSKGRHVMCRIGPRRSGLERQERFVEPLQLGNCNRRATPVAWCTQNCCPKEHSYDGHDTVLPSCPKGLGCIGNDAANFIEQRVSPEGTGLKQIRAV